MLNCSDINPKALYTIREVASLTGYSIGAVRNHIKRPVFRLQRVPKEKEHLLYLNTVSTVRKTLIQGSEIIRYYSMPINLPRKKKNTI